jgi:hypothetical protein
MHDLNALPLYSILFGLEVIQHNAQANMRKGGQLRVDLWMGLTCS